LRIKFIQRIIQAISAFVINSAPDFFRTKVVYGGPEKNLCLPVLNCHACPTARTTCPLGAIQTSLAYRQPGHIWFPLYPLGVLSLTSLLVGRAPCAWLCPFGFFQDLLSLITGKKITIPQKLNYLRYLVLIILVFILPYALHGQWFTKFCPMGTLEGTIPWLSMSSLLPGIKPGYFIWIKLSILAFVVIMSILTSRFFCRVLCPLGAILGIFNRLSLIRLKVESTCTKCGACRKICPMDISIYENDGSSDCIRCFRCTQCRHVSFAVGTKVIRKKSPPPESKNISGNNANRVEAADSKT